VRARKTIGIRGCTELPFLISQAHCGPPLLNTTVLHAEAALAIALGEQELPAAGRAGL
jgi:aspartate/glutamate racemase